MLKDSEFREASMDNLNLAGPQKHAAIPIIDLRCACETCLVTMVHSTIATPYSRGRYFEIA